MPRKPALTFAGALRILGRYEPEAVGTLDKALGSAILAAGTAAGAAAVVGTGGAFIPVATLLAAVWGWVDQKNEAIKLLQSVIGKLSDRMAGVKGVERRDLIVAAHSTIVAAAFFEVLQERLGRRRKRELALTAAERHLLTVGERKRATQSYYESIYWSTIPAPSPTCGFEENQRNISMWIAEHMDSMNVFLKGLAVDSSLTDLFKNNFGGQVLERYRTHYLMLAEKAPEFVFWAVLGEHAATRHRFETLNSDVQAILESHGQALTQVQALLSLVSNRGVDIGGQREGLHRANVGVLANFIVPSDTERYEANVTFPTIERAFVTPHYRAATHYQDSRPADEKWWSKQPIARDLGMMLAAHLTSAEATSTPLLLLGHPGAGKSILTKVLAAQLPPEEYTVVRVSLRSVSAGAPISDQIQQALNIASNGRLQWQTLSDHVGTVLVVLLDGLDELLQATDLDRSGYLRDVMEFQRIEGEQNRPVAVIVTSRTVVADRVDIPYGAMVVKLDEFDDDQVSAWLNEWRATNLSAIKAGSVRELTASEALHQADLARQPLLLLMLAIYAADPRAPKLDTGLSKSALYERIFDSFARREARKNPCQLRPDELNRIASDRVFRLAVAALAMFNRGVQSVRETDLRSDLVAITRQNNLRDDEGARLLGEFFFVHAPEATVRTTERAYEFLHATFGEYLVAKLVVGELDSLAHAAYGGRYSDRAPDDELLFALLSHQVWAARPSIGEFAKEIFATISPVEQSNIHRALTDLLRSFRQRRRSSEFDAYRPTPLDFIRQLAAYSANLTTISIKFSDSKIGLQLIGPFGDDPSESLANWRSALSLWRSGLDRDSWLSLLSTLNLMDGNRLVDMPPKFASFKMAGGDEYWTAMAGGDDVHASRIRRGLALVDRTMFHNQGPSWADSMLSWVQAHVFSSHNGDHLVSLVEDPPDNTDLADIKVVGDALCLLLRTRVHTLTKEFIFRAMKSLASYPDIYLVSSNTILTVAYVYPEVLLNVRKFQSGRYYSNEFDALQTVMDKGVSIIDDNLRSEWIEVRNKIFGADIDVVYTRDPLRELFTYF